MIVAPFAFVGAVPEPGGRPASVRVGNATNRCSDTASRSGPSGPETLAAPRIPPPPPTGTTPALLTGEGQAIHPQGRRTSFAFSNPSQSPIRCYRW
jgi:hypothetical protein